MIIDMDTLSAADTAVVLRARLGSGRSWPTFLSDNIRGRQSIGGHVLLPCCEQRGIYRLQPRYSLRDIEVFVHDVISDDPSLGRTPIAPRTLSIDTSRCWRLNTFDKQGSPVARTSA